MTKIHKKYANTRKKP